MTTLPTITIPSLLQIGKESLEMASQVGQFFFPKIMVGYGDGRDKPIQVSQYGGDFEDLLLALSYLAGEGPIEWIAVTNDAYMLASHIDTDDPDVQRVLNGEASVSELFEADHPAATESLQVLLVNRTSVQGGSAPYKRRGNRIVWTNPSNVKDNSTAEGRYVDALRFAVESSNA